MKFAKIYEMEDGGQVLCSIDYEDGERVLIIKTSINEMTAAAKHERFKDEVSNEDILSWFNEGHAKGWYNNIKNLLTLKEE